MIPAVVPFKTLDATKSRLRPAFGEATGRVTLAMLGDVLDALLRVPELTSVEVVTPDPEVAAAARALGAGARLCEDPGLNPAVDAAAAELAAADALLVVLGDVPGLRAGDVSALLAAAPPRGLALAASRDGGTPALVRVPPDVVPGGFGPDSARRHRELAEAAGVPCVSLTLPSLAIDVDAAGDLADLLASDAAAPRTRALRRAAADSGVVLAGGVLVVCQKVVSKAEGRLVRLAEVEPSEAALRIAAEDAKDPRHVEVVLRETVRVVRRGHGVLICETRHGFVCANAGVDLSNAPAGDVAVLLPVDPDASARSLRDALQGAGAGPLAVIVSDTFGRPWREGLVDQAIGCAGIAPLADLRGRPDWTGRELQVTTTATVDQLAAAAGLLMVKDAGVPAVWVEGVAPEGDGRLRDLLRDPTADLFR